MSIRHVHEFSNILSFQPQTQRRNRVQGTGTTPGSTPNTATQRQRRVSESSNSEAG